MRRTARGDTWPAGTRRAATLLAAGTVLVLAGCGGAGGTASAAGSPKTGVASPAGSTSPGAFRSDPSGPMSDLAAVLQRLGSGYTFDSTVTIDGAQATRVTGRWKAGSSELVVVAGGAALTYRSVPPVSWVEQADGTWVRLDGPAPGGDPLALFSRPLRLTPKGSASDGTAMDAVYAASALGLASGDAVTVHLTLGPDGTLRASYTTGTGTRAATVTTTIRPAPTQAAIPAPTTGAS